MSEYQFAPYILSLPALNLYNIHLLYAETWQERAEKCVLKREGEMARKKDFAGNAARLKRMMDMLKGR